MHLESENGWSEIRVGVLNMGNVIFLYFSVDLLFQPEAQMSTNPAV